jgi:hypothetical protein
MSAFGGKADNFKMSKILLIKIHRACSRLNVFWRCFEWCRNADHLRNRQRLRFKLIAYQDKRAKEGGSSDQEVRQQRHSHRPFSQQGRSAWYSKYGSGASGDLCCRSHPRRNSRWGVRGRNNDVRYWHKADMDLCAANVRSWGVKRTWPISL